MDLVYIHPVGMRTRVPHKIQSENFETGHLFSIAKLNFESICFLAFSYLRPFKLVHRHLKVLAFSHSKNEPKTLFLARF